MKNVPPNTMLAVAVLAAGAFIGGSVLWSTMSSAKTQGAAPPAPGAPSAPAVKVNITDVKTSGEPFVGDPNAPVTVAYWSDYQCPYCDRFETQTLPQLVQKYVNSGKVKVVFKDYS